MEDITRWISDSFEHLKIRWQAYIGPTLVFFGVTFGLMMVVMTVFALGAGAIMFAAVGPQIREEMDRGRRAEPAPMPGDYPDPDGYPGSDGYPETHPGQGSSPGSGYPPPPPNPFNSRESTRLAQMSVLLTVGYIVFIFVAIWSCSILIAPLQLRYMRGTLSLLRGGQFTMGDLFRGEGDVLRSIGLMFIMACVMMVAMTFFYFPALLLGVLFMFSYPVMADRKVGPVEAMKISMQLTRGKYWYLLLYIFLASAIMSLASMVPIVGSLASVPVMTVMSLTAYRSVLGETPVQRADQQVPPQYQTPGQELAAQENQERRVRF